MDGQKPKKRPNKALALTSAGLQMGLTIYLFVILGKWLDGKYNNGDKLYIIICTLLGTFISIYLIIKTLNQINDK
jgi:F0F1-type ATP synthase assembly protein I